jgi:hypothetical protein
MYIIACLPLRQGVRISARVEKYCFLSCLLDKITFRFTDFLLGYENISLKFPKEKTFPYIIYTLTVKVETCTLPFGLQSLKLGFGFDLRKPRKSEPSISFDLRKPRKSEPSISSDLRKPRKLESSTSSICASCAS